MNRSPTVALVEFRWVGHHPTYFRLYTTSLLEAGFRVLALCSQPEEVRGWDPAACLEGRLDAQEFTDEVQNHRWVRKIPQLVNRFRFQQCARRMAAWEACTGNQIDLVFFACFYEGIAVWGRLDAIFPYRWTGLLLESGCVRLPNGPGKWLRIRSFDSLALFREPGCLSLATLDTFIQEDLRRRLGGKPVYVLPDIIDDSPPNVGFPLAEKIRLLADGRRIIGCFGQFARRKGALGFLRLAEACQEEPWFFAWAGELEEKSFTKSELDWVKAFLGTRPANCHVEFGRVADGADFNALIALSSVLYLCYHRHIGSSNMITKAAQFDKLVLVSDGYCMADQVRSCDLGLCVDPDDLASCRRAIRDLLDPATKLQPRFSEYRQMHSKEKFSQTLRAMTQLSVREIVLR